MRKGDAVKEEVGEGLRTLRSWFFAHDGFNEDKEALKRGKGVLWSASDDFDDFVGLRQL